MKKYKNQALWRTYLFVVFFSIVVTASFLYAEWQEIKDHAGIEQSYANNLVSHSMESLLQKNSNLLKVLGERFVELVGEGEIAQVQKSMNQVLRVNTELIGLGLVDVNGQLIVSTFKHMPSQVPNLLTKAETKDTFRKTLESSKLVMGRTYYFQALNSWVIPIRLRVLDSEGQVAAVVVAGFKLGASHGLWSRENLPKHLALTVVRGDYYRQYVSYIDENEYQDWYGSAVESKFVEYVDNLFKVQAGVGIKALRAGDKLVSAIVPNKRGELNFASISYDPVFEHFTIVSTRLDLLYDKFWYTLSWVLSAFILFNIGLFIIFRLNIRLHLQTEQSLHHQIEHDPLTKLPNRRFLTQNFESWANKYSQGFSLLYIDLNNFKSSNDLHGHSVGDQILCEVASRTTEHFQDCMCIRQGGDEFIILTGMRDKGELNKLCKAYLEVLRNPVSLEHLEFSIKASIGVAISPFDGKVLDELQRKADMAMYEAKQKQSDICFYSVGMEEKTKRAADIEKELLNALEKGEMCVVYQPQVDSQSQKVLGVEALVRWQSDVLGFVPPDQFISVAEATGVIHELGEFVLKTALDECLDACKQSQHAPFKLRVSVNVSVRQLLNEDFVPMIKQLVERYDGEALTLMIEVTESLFIEDLDKAKDVLNQVSLLGVYTSLDDFGTGYSSLSVLSKLPINELKIDRSFVNDILIDEQDWLLAKSIINLSKSLSIPVVAEGVETKEQADILAANGCDVFQGYYFAKPMSKNELVSFLRE